MRLALVKNGPFAVGFEVYDDFMSYRKGVYHHTFTVDRVNRLSLLLNPSNPQGEQVDKWDPFQVQKSLCFLSRPEVAKMTN